MRVASISSEVKCHNWSDGALINTYQPKQCLEIKSVAWGKDGGWMVIVPKSRNAEIISVNREIKLLHTIHDIYNPICAAFQNATKRNIAIGTSIGQILVYDIKEKSIKKKFPLAPSKIFKIQYCRKDGYVAGGCENGEVLVYNNKSDTLSCSFKVPNSCTLSNFHCHALQRHLIGGCSEEGIVNVWDVNKSKALIYNQSHNAPVSDICFSSQNDLLVSLGLDRKIVLYDYVSDTVIQEVRTKGTPTALDFSPDGVGFVAGFHDGKLLAYDIRNMKEGLHTFVGHTRRIKQVMFEKENDAPPLNTADSIPDIQVENVTDGEMVVEVAKQDSLGPRGDHSLSDIAEVEDEASISNVSVKESIRDSFIDALGYKRTPPPLSSKRDLSTDSVCKMYSSPPPPTSSHFIQEVQICNTSSVLIKADQQNTDAKIRKTHIDNFIKTQTYHPHAATPDFKMTPPSSSPIYPLPQQQQPQPQPQPEQQQQRASFDEEKLKKIIQEIVRKEMKGIQKHINAQLFDLKAQVNRQFMDLQMSVVRECITIEDDIAQLHEELTVPIESPSSIDMLYEENYELMQQVERLKLELYIANKN